MTFRHRPTTEERAAVERVIKDLTCVPATFAEVCVAFTKALRLNPRSLTNTLRVSYYAHLSTEIGAKSFIKGSAAYKASGKPLKGKALEVAAQRNGLKFREAIARSSAGPLREQLSTCGTKQQSRAADISLREKLMEKEREKKMVKLARDTTVVRPASVWSGCRKLSDQQVTNVITAIRKAAMESGVFTLELSGCVVLLENISVWERVLLALKDTRVFILGLGEDTFVLGKEHFELLRSMILDGELAVRRWFVECGGGSSVRRRMLVDLQMVSHSSVPATIFTTARREDIRLWKESPDNQHLPRLAWLSAPKCAWESDSAMKAALQNTVCTYKIANSHKS
jgi:hypothetical protein